MKLFAVLLLASFLAGCVKAPTSAARPSAVTSSTIERLNNAYQTSSTRRISER